MNKIAKVLCFSTDRITDNVYSEMNIGLTLRYLNKMQELIGVHTELNYKIPEGMELEKGDYVVLSTRDSLEICFVRDILEDTLINMEEVNNLKGTIIGKVDISVRLGLIQKEERARYLKEKIEELEKTFKERQMLEIIAQNDPEAKKYIDEYKQLVMLGGTK